MSSAATKVFSIAELAEQILLDFINISHPHKTASISLHGIERVSHSFNNTISATPSLQRTIDQPPNLEYFRRCQYEAHKAIDITKSHGAHVDVAFLQAIECWVDTDGESWRKTPFLGDKKDYEYVDFGNVKMKVGAGETFGSVVERVKELLIKALEHKMVMVENARAYGLFDETEGESWTVCGQ